MTWYNVGIIDVIALGSAVIALLSFTGAIATFFITKRRENYQNIYERILFYSSPEMHAAIQRLWNLYKEWGEIAFVDKYIEIMETEDEEVKTKPVAEQPEFIKSTLHYQRRLVYTFWSGLGILLKNKLLSKKVAFAWWSRGDVEIVGKILIPIQNRLTEHFSSGLLRPEIDPLYYIAAHKKKFYELLQSQNKTKTMKPKQPNRKTFFLALIDYARDSQTFNPHFQLSEMLGRLGIDEGMFNILLHSLGPKYCHFVDVHGNENRYAINLSECLSLKDQLDLNEQNQRQYKKSYRLSILLMVLGAALGAALTSLFNYLQGQ